MPNVLACLTQADWDGLLQGDLAPHVLVTRLKLCGIASLKEDSKKVSIALLVPSLLWHGDKMPDPQEIRASGNGVGTCAIQAFEKGLLEEVTCEHFATWTQPGTVESKVSLVKAHNATKKWKAFLEAEKPVRLAFLAS